MRIVGIVVVFCLTIQEVWAYHNYLNYFKPKKKEDPPKDEVIDDSWKKEGFFKDRDVCTLNEERALQGSKNASAVYKNYTGSGVMFYDETFPADNTSLFWPNTNKTQLKALFTFYDKVEWFRPKELHAFPNLWGKKGIRPRDAIQGQLTNCWFMAAAASLAEFPERVKKIFTNDYYPQEGIFEITFYMKGEPIKVIIDDRIPTASNAAIHAQMSLSRAWWMLILEKAYAKINMNYANLDGGFGEEGLRALTGMPIDQFFTAELTVDQMAKIIHGGQQKNYVMTASCTKTMFGLAELHAYTLLDSIYITDKDNNQIQLIKMRNPWASETYVGPWNDDDKRWTQDLRKQADHEKVDDGIFFMTPSDFKKGFSAFEIALYRDDWIRDTHYEKSLGSKFMYVLPNPVEQEVIISLDQTPQRQIVKGCNKAPGSYYAIYFYKLMGGKVEEIPIPPQIGYGHIFRKSLPAGNYELTVKNWENGDPSEFQSDFRLTSYTSDKEVKIWERIAYIEYELEECLQSPQCSFDYDDMICELKDDDVELCSYWNKQTNNVTIRVNQEYSRYNSAGTMIEAYLMTTDGFPWTTTLSNYEWANEKRTLGWTYGKQWYILNIFCPKRLNVCVYQIPNITKYRKATFMSN